MIPRVLLLAVAVFVAGGCATPLEYAADRTLVGQLGAKEAESRLGEVITRALAPRFVHVAVSSDHYSTTYHQDWHPYQFGPVGNVPMQIYYRNIDRVVLYDNNRAFVYDTNGVERQWIQFATAEDAKLFADLVLSFQASVDGASP